MVVESRTWPGGMATESEDGFFVMWLQGAEPGQDAGLQTEIQNGICCQAETLEKMAAKTQI